jgi:hypothetical protein
MSNHGVYPSVAKHYVPYQDAFGNNMQETTYGKQTKTDYRGGDAAPANYRGGKSKENDDISNVASGKKILFGLHRGTILNIFVLAK